MNTVIDPSTFAPDKLTIPAEASQEEWASIHRTVILCRKASAAWLKQSRAFAVERWGVEFVAEQEVQMELSLGLPEPEPKPELNPNDKSKAIVTIEGITQSFVLWQRKMGSEIETWDRARLEKARDLLEPMESQARRIRQLLNDI
jgi:hypothetical protein